MTSWNCSPASAQRSGAVLVSDEVWEHVVFDGLVHRSVLSLPGMRERAVKIGSAGKIFGMTGWKVGFVCAAPELMRVLSKAHQFLTFTTPPSLQHAVAYGLGKEPGLVRRHACRPPALARPAGGGAERSRLRSAALGRHLFPQCRSGAARRANLRDEAFCRLLVERHGVAAIPVSAFYAGQPVESVIRFCFAKTDATLDRALDRLGGFFADHRAGADGLHAYK